MSEDIFVGIVAEEGSKQAICSGLFRFDPIQGYEGKLLVPFEPTPGDNLFDLPVALRKTALYCIIDGSNFGTILWPDFTGGHQIKNFAARLINLRIRQILTGAHVNATAAEILKIRVVSPIFSYLFGLAAYKTSFEFNPYRANIQSVNQQATTFDCEIGKLAFGASGTISPDILAPKLSTVAYLDITFCEPKTLFDCLKLIRKLEHLFSILIFDFMKFEGASLFVPIQDANSNEPSERDFGLTRARLNDRAKVTVDRHEIPLHLNGCEFGPVVDRFLALFDSIEQTLNWYRIVVAEERYLEDRFFYSLRMIEALSKRLKLEATADEIGRKAIEEIILRLDRDEASAHLAEFARRRIYPIFSQGSLADIINSLKREYREIRAIEIIDARQVIRLRGKEAHGSIERFSPDEYQFMAYTYDILSIIYRLMILEECGFERADLYAELKNSHRFSRYFNEATLEEYRKALAG